MKKIMRQVSNEAPRNIVNLSPEAEEPKVEEVVTEAPVKEGPTGPFTDSFPTAEGANGPAGPVTPLFSAAKGFDVDAKDGDGDGLVQDGTVHERPLGEIKEVVSEEHAHDENCEHSAEEQAPKRSRKKQAEPSDAE